MLRKFIHTSIIEYLKECKIYEEINIAKYRIQKSSDKQYYGYFSASELKYTVSIYHDDNKHKFGVWEVEFSVSNQTNAGYRTKKDLKHLNIVLYTVFEIVQEVVKSINIKSIYIDSANDEFDENAFNTTRADLYYRFLKSKFGPENIDRQGRFIHVYFSEMESTNLQIIKNILIDISDNYYDAEGVDRGISGIDDNNFEINTDFISNENVGDIYFEIIVNEKSREYSLTYEILDTGSTESVSYDSFDSLVGFLQDFRDKVKNS